MTTQHPQPALRDGLIAIPATHEELAATVHDLHALGLPPASITVLGKAEKTPEQRQETAKHLACLIDAGTEHEVVGAVLGAALGLLGGVAMLALPGVGPLVIAGGAAAMFLEGFSAGALGASLGAAVATLTDLSAVAEHERLFERELANGRWILVITGKPDALRRAEIALSTHKMVHQDRI